MSSEENKRGQVTAVLALALQAVLTALFAITWRVSGSVVAGAVFHLMVAALPVWVVTAVLYYCQRMAELESAELDELAKTGRGALFAEGAGELRLARRRLRWMNRWAASTVTLLVAAYLLGMAFLGLRPLLAGVEAEQATDGGLLWSGMALLGAFPAFLASRVFVGMAREPAYRMLRAGGSLLAVGAFAAGLLCVTLFVLPMGVLWPHQVLAYVMLAVLAVLGVELAANMVLDIYRPRVAGVIARPSFDSRLASLLSEPGGIAHSIAEALNYQFGFEVSGTWFYKLLQRALVPLLLFGVLSLIGISSIVVVDPGRRAVILTWGEPPAGEESVGPGIHFKLPWPIQTADIFDVERVRLVQVGVGAGRSARAIEADVVNGVEVYLWQKEHGERQEENFLVARKQTRSDDGAKPAPAAAPGEKSGPSATAEQYNAVGLVRIILDVHYKVNDVYRFHYGVADAELLLERAAYRALTRYASRRDIDTLMSAERGQVADALTAEINETIGPGHLDLGVKIVTLTLHGMHPPTDVAEAFEEVIKADRERVGKILQAGATAKGTISRVAGKHELAIDIAEALWDERDIALDADERKAAGDRAEELLGQLEGAARTRIDEARADRWAMVNAERSRYGAYRSQLATFKKAPRLWKLAMRLNVLSKGLSGARKYVVGRDPKGLEFRNEDKRSTVTGNVLMGPQE